MKSFFQFINEGKNIGPLYHFTSLSDTMSRKSSIKEFINLIEKLLDQSNNI